MIEARIFKIDTGEVVRKIPLKGVTSLSDSRVDRIEMGLMRNMNLAQYSVLTVDTEQEEKNDHG